MTPIIIFIWLYFIYGGGHRLLEISLEYSLEGLMLKLTLQYFGHLLERTDSLEKTLMLGKIEDRRRRGRQRMRWLGGITGLVGLDGHEFEQAPGVGDGQGGLACCSPWGCKESDTTEWLNWTGYYRECSKLGGKVIDDFVQIHETSFTSCLNASSRWPNINLRKA